MRKLSVNINGMNRTPKPIQQAKRVTPPAIPEIYRHSGSSFGSTGYGSGEDANSSISNLNNCYLTVTEPSTPNSTGSDYANSGNQLSATMIEGNNNFKQQQHHQQEQQQQPKPQQQAFVFPVGHSQHQPLTHKAAVYYHQQLALQEDQGIDLTQSPGRDSPGSSSGSAGSGSRHSTASLDSGRASSYHTGTSASSASTRLTCGVLNSGCGVGGVISSPRCSSVSSCSTSSVDRMCRTDHEIIADWLRELCFEEYAPLFSAAGYDMPTISRMTPEDLTAIGIKKPRHRERIKQHIDALQLPDNLPHIVPGSIEEWLRLLRLEEYIQPLLAQGYETVRDVIQLPWEDMEDIGIVKLGHQKKLLLAIKRIKDIMSGKWISPGISHSPQECLAYQQFSVPWDKVHLQQQYYQQMNPHFESTSQLSPLTVRVDVSQYQQVHPYQQQQIMSQSAIMENENNDIVLIKLRQPRGRSLESLENADERLSAISHLTFTQSGNTVYNPHGINEAADSIYDLSVKVPKKYMAGHYQLSNASNIHQIRRSYDDGDLTPTNEMSILNDPNSMVCLSSGIEDGGGTLPRHRGSNINMVTGQKQKPIAKVIGNVSSSSKPQQQIQYLNQSDYLEKNPCATKCYGTHCVRPGAKSMVMEKKQAPDPPRRHFNTSITTDIGDSAIDEICEHYDALKLAIHHQQVPAHSYDPQMCCHYIHQKPIRPSTQYINVNSCHIVHNQPIYANYNPVSNNCQPMIQHVQTTAEVHAEKPQSINGHESSTSIDSIDAIPFANDNAGTIKQRSLNSQYHSVTSAADVSQNVSSIETDGSNIGPSILLTNASPPSQTLSQPATSPPIVEKTDEFSIEQNTNLEYKNNIDSNVLNDIGNMLANLTDELDAMLEEEKRVGLNDSE